MSVSLNLDIDVLRPLIECVVSETVEKLRDDEARLGGKIAFSEQEAARLLSLTPAQLRDERKRHRISASVGPSGRVRYQRVDLLNYLKSRPWSECGRLKLKTDRARTA